MAITEDQLQRCLWSLRDRSLRSVLKAFQDSPALTGLVASPQHNFVPIFCLPKNSTVPVLRSRVALPQKYKGILRPRVIQVQVSTCIPVAVYGETRISLSAQGCGYDFLTTNDIQIVNTYELLAVEQAVLTLLQASQIECLTREQIAKPLPESIQLYVRGTHLDALFMKDDYPY